MLSNHRFGNEVKYEITVSRIVQYTDADAKSSIQNRSIRFNVTSKANKHKKDGIKNELDKSNATRQGNTYHTDEL